MTRFKKLLAAAALVALLASPGTGTGPDEPAAPPTPENLFFLARDAWAGEKLSDYCDGAAPLFEAYGFARLDLFRYEDARSAECAIERYAMTAAGGAYGLFGHLAGTTPVVLEGMFAAWSDGVGLLLSGETCWRVVGLDRVPFMLWARAMAAAGASPAAVPPDVAGESEGPGVQFVRLLPTATHLENHRPDLAGVAAIAEGAKRFLLVDRVEEGRPAYTLVAEAKGPAFDRAALARDLEAAGFTDVRRLGSRITARTRRGTLEFRFEGNRLRVQPLPANP